ncbi:MAG: zinc-ribbon domain containing protein [Planctomycetes bacterium]|nr:zinc-ribbon domain containing protein [Planctomycetota bacterium]
MRIPDTAIEANGSRQKWVAGTSSYGFGLYVRYYFDVKRECRDCKRPFIFFAEEQKYWYERLGIPLEIDCVRCFGCRRKQRKIERARKRYNELFAISEPASPELIELVSLSLDMIKDGEFAAHPRTFGRIRMWLNRLSKDTSQEVERIELRNRLAEIEASQQKAMRRLMNELGQEENSD